MKDVKTKIIVILLYAIVLFQGTEAQSDHPSGIKPDSYSRKTVVGKDTISVFIDRIPFRKSSHRIDSSKIAYGRMTRGRDTKFLIGKIDGRHIYGSDMELPRFEIDRFVVSWNGKPVRIQKELYADCFDPNFEFMEPPPLIQMAPSENASRVLIEMEGSDAAGSYTVWWIISRDGKHTRFIQESEFR